MKLAASALLGALLCAGCAPLPVTVATLIADGVSYATTEKSLTDHGISAFSEQDCAMHRLLTDGIICREIDGEVVLAGGDVETLVLAPVVARPSSPTVDPSASHLGSIGDPVPGIYMVLASSRDPITARTLRVRNTTMSPLIFAMPAGEGRVIYHVVIGPITQSTYPGARKAAAAFGFENTWALKIDDVDWQRAKELESKTGERLAVTRVKVFN